MIMIKSTTPFHDHWTLDNRIAWQSKLLKKTDFACFSCFPDILKEQFSKDIKGTGFNRS